MIQSTKLPTPVPSEKPETPIPVIKEDKSIQIEEKEKDGALQCQISYDITSEEKSQRPEIMP